MNVTWVVVVRKSSTTVFEYENFVRRTFQVRSRAATYDGYAQEVAKRLTEEAAEQPPQDIVLLALPALLGPIRRAMSPDLARRVRVASNSITSADDRASLRAFLAPIVSRAVNSGA